MILRLVSERLGLAYPNFLPVIFLINPGPVWVACFQTICAWQAEPSPGLQLTICKHQPGTRCPLEPEMFPSHETYWTEG